MRGGPDRRGCGSPALLPSVDHSDSPQLRGGTLRDWTQDRHPSAVPGYLHNWIYTKRHTAFHARFSKFFFPFYFMGQSVSLCGYANKQYHEQIIVSGKKKHSEDTTLAKTLPVAERRLAKTEER